MELCYNLIFYTTPFLFLRWDYMNSLITPVYFPLTIDAIFSVSASAAGLNAGEAI